MVVLETVSLKTGTESVPERLRVIFEYTRWKKSIKSASSNAIRHCQNPTEELLYTDLPDLTHSFLCNRAETEEDLLCCVRCRNYTYIKSAPFLATAWRGWQWSPFMGGRTVGKV